MSKQTEKIKELVAKREQAREKLDNLYFQLIKRLL